MHGAKSNIPSYWYQLLYDMAVLSFLSLLVALHFVVEMHIKLQLCLPVFLLKVKVL